jgi:hypothetical protein
LLIASIFFRKIRDFTKGGGPDILGMKRVNGGKRKPR